MQFSVTVSFPPSSTAWPASSGTTSRPCTPCSSTNHLTSAVAHHATPCIRICITSHSGQPLALVPPFPLLVRVLATVITLRAGPLPVSCVHGALCSTSTRPMVALWSFRDLTRVPFSLTTILIGKVRGKSNNSVLQRFALAFAPTARAGGVNKAYHGAKLGKNDSWPRVYATLL